MGAQCVLGKLGSCNPVCLECNQEERLRRALGGTGRFRKTLGAVFQSQGSGKFLSVVTRSDLVHSKYLVALVEKSFPPAKN